VLPIAGGLCSGLYSVSSSLSKGLSFRDFFLSTLSGRLISDVCSQAFFIVVDTRSRDERALRADIFFCALVLSGYFDAFGGPGGEKEGGPAICVPVRDTLRCALPGPRFSHFFLSFYERFRQIQPFT